MSTPTTFRPFEDDELAVRAAGEAEDLLWTAVKPQLAEVDPEHPALDPEALVISCALPYSWAAKAYASHVDRCTACQDSPVYDIECEQGNRLAAQAADACARQSLRAVLN